MNSGQDGMEQAEVIAFLASPPAHGGAEVEHVETHISHLFLAGDRAYKLKKAQALPFLDFSTLELREAGCRRELEVNHASGDLYLGVRPALRAADGTLSLGADAPPPAGQEIVEWLVEMRRFDRALEFDKLLAEGRLGRRDMERLGDRIAEMHRNAEIRRTRESAAASRSTAANLADALSDEAWREQVMGALDAVAPLLDARGRHGFVRRCHGDLHLANIVMVDGAPTPFDAIEFSERIATTDVAYDIAFTVMDLLSHDAPELANALLCRYLGATRDYGCLAAFPTFLSIRAAIRAMTAEMRGADEAVVAPRRRVMTEALSPRPAPRLLVVAGLSGTGKSTLARGIAPHLAPLYGAVVVSSDVTRKRMFGQSPEQKLPSEAYRLEISVAVYRRMLVDAARALKAGASVILDGVFSHERARRPAEDLAERLGVPFEGIWLQMDRDARVDRVSQRVNDPSDADVSIAARQGGEAPKGSQWRRMSAQGAPGEVLDRALAALKVSPKA